MAFSTFIATIVFSLRMVTSVYGQTHLPSVVDIPGVGVIDLDALPADVRANLRLPGEHYQEAPEEYRDLPEIPNLDTIPVPNVRPPAETTSQGPHQPTARDLTSERAEENSDLQREQEGARERVEKQMYQERAYPDSEIPPDAYHKAWTQIERMQQAVPPEEQPSMAPQTPVVPQQWMATTLNWLAPVPAIAQASFYFWGQIGPAPLFTYNHPVDPAGNFFSGVVVNIAVDPRDSSRIYLGTPFGGLWRSTDAGATWAPLTDSQPPLPSMQVEAVAIHPQNSSIIFAGTGPDADMSSNAGLVQRSFGTYRTIDGGTTWCRIGPTWPGTDPTQSTLAIVDLAIEPASPYRVWAATSRGLWYSDNAANNPSSCSSQVTWLLAKLPSNGSTPEAVTRFFISPLTGQRLYAAIGGSTIGNNGWWKSADHDSTQWTHLPAPAGLSETDKVVWKAAISAVNTTTPGPNTPTPTPNADVIYAVVKGATAIEKTTDSGTSWTLFNNPIPLPSALLSIAADPANASIVALGAVYLYRSTDGGMSFTEISTNDLHADHRGLRFTAPNVLFDGNDGGIFKTSNFCSAPGCPVPTWSNLNHGNLANTEFYAGVIDSLNYGFSYGGLQDDGAVKGAAGQSLTWAGMRAFGDAAMVIVDPQSSNVAYVSDRLDGSLLKTINGGGTDDLVQRVGGLPTTGTPPKPLVAHFSLAMDPSDHKTLFLYSNLDSKIYRTTSAAEGANAWLTVSPAAPAQVQVIAAAPVPPPTPRANLVFAGTVGGGVWHTVNVNAPTPTWTLSQNGLPDRIITGIAVDSSQCSSTQVPCTAGPTGCTCTLYVSAHGFDDGPPPPFQGHGHIFRTTYTGEPWSALSWTNISGDLTSSMCQANPSPCLPNLPVNKVVLHPTMPNVVYIATDLGIFQGCLGCKAQPGQSTCDPSGTNWICNAGGTTWFWGLFTNSFPQAALVLDLAVHRESGTLRAFTSGRSAWESQPFTPPNPDMKVNSSSPVTEARSPRASSGRSGKHYSIAWVDDRLGANNWHPYYRAYGYDANNRPTPLGSDSRIDDTTAHRAQGVSLSQHPYWVLNPMHAVAAWYDNRNYCTDPPYCTSTTNNIFFQHVLSDGSKLFTNDVRVDQAGANLNAMNPAVTYQLSTDLAVAWQQIRSGSLYDIYARFFFSYGAAKGNACKVNSTTGSSVRPALVSDSNSYVFVAWEDPPRIYAAKFDASGTCLIGSGSSCTGTPCPQGSPAVPLDDGSGSPFTSRSQPSLAIDDANNVIVTWWETNLTVAGARVVARRCDNNLANCVTLDAQCGKRCDQGSNNGLPCVSGSDCPAGQCRNLCVGGTNDGIACTLNADCPGGSCPAAVSCPPALPLYANTAQTSSVATAPGPTPGAGQPGSIAVAWQGNVNNAGVAVYSGFARSFDANLTSVKNDFRPDLANLSYVDQMQVVRSLISGQFAYSWRDNRTGKFEVFTRLVPSMQ